MSATRPRTQAREAALKALYLLDLRPDSSALELEEAMGEELRSDEARRFARGLLQGTRSRLAEIDAEVEAVAHNWNLKRMAVVDRNVLRLGAYELLFCRDEIPPAVAIDEAVSIVKRFSSRESGAFVNGILDKIRLRAERGEGQAPSAGPGPGQDQDAQAQAQAQAHAQGQEPPE